jgi:hypothetical protein
MEIGQARDDPSAPREKGKIEFLCKRGWHGGGQIIEHGLHFHFLPGVFLYSGCQSPAVTFIFPWVIHNWKQAMYLIIEFDRRIICLLGSTVNYWAMQCQGQGYFWVYIM